eukprot:5368474-Pleurochrysis_carterae.AAC.1
MDESPCMRRLVMSGVVRMAGRVSFGAGSAAVEVATSERGRGIGRYSGQVTQPRGTGVKAGVHARGGCVWRHDAH